MTHHSWAVAAALLGGVLGLGVRRQLATLGYRRGPIERALPHPGPRWWVPAAVLIAYGLLALAFVPTRWPLALVSAPVAVAGVWLSAVDVDVKRLPDVIALPLLAWVVAGVLGAAALQSNVSILGAVAGAAALGGFLWLLNLFPKGHLGFGDVKAGLTLGLLVGALSLPAVWWVGMLAFTGAAAATLAGNRREPLALGPWLYAAGFLVLAAQ